MWRVVVVEEYFGVVGEDEMEEQLDALKEASYHHAMLWVELERECVVVIVPEPEISKMAIECPIQEHWEAVRNEERKCCWVEEQNDEVFRVLAVVVLVVRCIASFLEEPLEVLAGTFDALLVMGT